MNIQFRVFRQYSIHSSLIEYLVQGVQLVFYTFQPHWISSSGCSVSILYILASLDIQFRVFSWCSIHSNLIGYPVQGVQLVLYTLQPHWIYGSGCSVSALYTLTSLDIQFRMFSQCSIQSSLIGYPVQGIQLVLYTLQPHRISSSGCSFSALYTLALLDIRFRMFSQCSIHSNLVGYSVQGVQLVFYTLQPHWISSSGCSVSALYTLTSFDIQFRVFSQYSVHSSSWCSVSILYTLVSLDIQFRVFSQCSIHSSLVGYSVQGVQLVLYTLQPCWISSSGCLVRALYTIN